MQEGLVADVLHRVVLTAGIRTVSASGRTSNFSLFNMERRSERDVPAASCRSLECVPISFADGDTTLEDDTVIKPR